MSTTALQLKVDELNRMTVPQIVEDQRVKDKFVQLYNSIHGEKSGELIYHKEKFNFMRLISEKAQLKD